MMDISKQKMYFHDITYAGATMRVYHVDKGEGIPMHGHQYHHGITVCAGSCNVSLETGKSIVMTKYTQPVNLLAGIQHEIEALEDGTVFFTFFEEGKY